MQNDSYVLNNYNDIFLKMKSYQESIHYTVLGINTVFGINCPVAHVMISKTKCKCY